MWRPLLLLMFVGCSSPLGPEVDEPSGIKICVVNRFEIQEGRYMEFRHCLEDGEELPLGSLFFIE